MDDWISGGFEGQNGSRDWKEGFVNFDWVCVQDEAQTWPRWGLRWPRWGRWWPKRGSKWFKMRLQMAKIRLKKASCGLLDLQEKTWKSKNMKILENGGPKFWEVSRRLAIFGEKKSVVLSSRFMEVHFARTGRTFITKCSFYNRPTTLFCGFIAPAISKNTSKERFGGDDWHWPGRGPDATLVIRGGHGPP